MTARHRTAYVLWVGVVIVLGLASRSDALALPSVVAKYAGDALWALMLFLGLGFLLPTRRTLSVAVLAAALSCAVEFSQLYHPPWMDAARRTRFGQLVLGDTFGLGDIVAYFVGIGFGASVEWAALRTSRANRV